MTTSARPLGAVLFLIALSACHDPSDPIHVESAANNNSASIASTVEWVDNMLEFVDDNGTNWRFVRDHPSATHVWIYENGVMTARLNLVWSGSTPTGAVFSDGSSYWMQTDSNGYVTSAFPGGGSCAPEDWPDCHMPEFGFNGGCAEEAAARDQAAWDAVGAGLFAIATSTTPIAPASATAFGVFTGRAVAHLARWAICVLVAVDTSDNNALVAAGRACADNRFA